MILEQCLTEELVTLVPDSKPAGDFPMDSRVKVKSLNQFGKN